MADNSQRNGLCEVLQAAVWICGEFAELEFCTISCCCLNHWSQDVFLLIYLVSDDVVGLLWI